MIKTFAPSLYAVWDKHLCCSNWSYVFCARLRLRTFLFRVLSMVCTFFGHRQIYNAKEIEPTLRSALVELIENCDVKTFYVGNHGAFDTMAQRVLKELASIYPISCFIVLAYLPEKAPKEPYRLETLFPEGIETVPKRLAILYRNKWLIEHSDYVITYVTHDLGSGAAQFKALAEKSYKTVIEIAQ